jgi:hypothetical protein
MAPSTSLFTPATAKAIMAPWRLALTAVAGVAAAVLGAPWWLAIITAASFFLITMPLSIPRAERVPRIDAFALSEPWRRYVSSAQKAHTRYLQTVRSAQQGPLRTRLEEIGRKLEDGLQECWTIARDGDRIDATLARLRASELQANLVRLRTEQQTTPSDATEATIASLEQQLATADRLRTRSTEASDRLRLAQTQLDQLVASAAEVAAGIGDGDLLESGIESVVTELEALRLAVEETNGQPEPPPEPRALPGT